MTTDIQPRICCHVNDGCFCISLSDSESLFLTIEEAQRLLQQLDEMITHASIGEDGHVEILDVPLSLGELVVLRDEMAAVLELECVEEIDWKREGF